MKGVIVWEILDEKNLEELMVWLLEFKSSHEGCSFETFIETKHNHHVIEKFFDALLNRVRE